MLRLSQRRAVVRALIRLAVEINRRFEPRRVIWTFSDTYVRRQIKAAPLRQLLQLVLIHLSISNVSNQSRTNLTD
ncbi:hypothetical protein Hanom_Chr07g00669281 [Helianthus anomalus]